MLLDSNIIIYSAKPEHRALRDFIAVNSPAVSAVSYVEVLGYHRHTEVERKAWEAFFSYSSLLPIDQPVLDQAVMLRQMRRMSLGDALIAATALVHSRQLVTHNVDDFRWVPGLRLIDPLSPTP